MKASIIYGKDILLFGRFFNKINKFFLRVENFYVGKLVALKFIAFKFIWRALKYIVATKYLKIDETSYTKS